MSFGRVSGVVLLAMALGACGTSAPRASSVQAAADDGADIILEQASGPSDADTRVKLNDKQALDAAGGDRVVVSAMRSALRTGNLNAYLKALDAASCPAGGASRVSEAIDSVATPIALQPSDPARRKVGSLTYVAGYQLTSSDKRFGGLSGIEVLSDDTLLAISDAGYFVWIKTTPDGMKPLGMRISAMNDLGGQSMVGVEGDSAEGLAVNGGMALVSIEGNHRVLAFALGKCGAAARGAPIVFEDYGAPLSEAYEDSRVSVGAGDGSEALGVTTDWYLLAGIEKKVDKVSPLSVRPVEAEPEFNLHVGVDAPEFTGIDVIPSRKGDGALRAFLLHRAKDPADGRIWVTETDLHRFEDRTRDQGPVRGDMDARARLRYSETGWRELAQLSQTGVADSFEGIAARELSDGRVRLYLISDDDYSPDKRTVLMIFDLARSPR